MEASEWDRDPDAYRFAAAALQAILTRYPELEANSKRNSEFTDGPDVLEIGCATGIFSLGLSPFVRSILAVDTAVDMIEILRLKLEGGTCKQHNITPLCVFLDSSDIDERPVKFDFAVGHLVLHHVADHSRLLDTMHHHLKPGGRIVLTDFENFGKEARLFHAEGKMADVEHEYGIEKVQIAKRMVAAGFAEVSVDRAWITEKDVERYPWEWGPKGLDKPCHAGRARIPFPFLLCHGVKKITTTRQSC